MTDAQGHCPYCGSTDIRTGLGDVTFYEEGYKKIHFEGKCHVCHRELDVYRYMDPVTKEIVKVRVLGEDTLITASPKTEGRHAGTRRYGY